MNRPTIFLIIVVTATIFMIGCAGTSHDTTTATTRQAGDTPTATTHEPTNLRFSPSELPGIEEVGNSRWGARYTIFVSPQWHNPMVFELVPNGRGGETKVRVPPSNTGSFSITAKTNPSRAIITYQGQDGARHRVCTMRGLEVFMNLQRTGFGMDGVDCEFIKVFHLSDIEGNVAAQ